MSVKKIRATLSVVVASLALAVVAVPLTATAAVDSPAYYGYASCSSPERPGSQAVSYGVTKHQIGTGVAESYLTKEVDLGSNPGISRYRFGNTYASWATISTPGGQRLFSTSWGCRAAGWS